MNYGKLAVFGAKWPLLWFVRCSIYLVLFGGLDSEGLLKRFLVALLIVFAGAFVAPVAYAVNNCTGATYYDADSDTCISCPAGYDYNDDAGKTSITQCQIHCNAGTYVKNAGSVDFTPVEYLESTGSQYIDIGGVDINNANNTRARFIVDTSFAQTGSGGSSVLHGLGTSYGGPGVGFVSMDGGSAFVTATNDLYKAYNSQSGVVLNRRYLLDLNVLTRQFQAIDVLNNTTAANENVFPKNYVSGTKPGFMLFGYYSSNGTPVTNSSRVYGAKLYDNGVLKRDMVPVRRNSDNALGMYDLINGNFYANSGTGTFNAGADVTGCQNVGVGYYAGESVVNYGSAGTRTACPVGTYSGNTNGTSVAVCQLCDGATYSDDVGSGACKACPNGYDYNIVSGKTDITQCQIQCDGGTYAPDYTQLEYIKGTGTQYIDTNFVPTDKTRSEIEISFTNDTYTVVPGGNRFFGTGNHGLNFGGDSYQAYQVFPWLCGSNCTTRSVQIDRNLKTTRQTVILDAKNKRFSYGTVNQSLASQTIQAPTDPIYLFAYNRGANGPNIYRNNGGMFMYEARIYNDDELVRHMIPVRRNSDNVLGMYDFVTGDFFENAGTGDFIAGSEVGQFSGNRCIDVGAGYWAPGGVFGYGALIARTACAAGLTTVGYGHGADNANDCARILHVGDHVLYGRRDKVTIPSLNIKVPNEDPYYIHLSSSDQGFSGLHLLFNGQKYTSYDDSIGWGERDFDTGQRIEQ